MRHVCIAIGMATIQMACVTAAAVPLSGQRRIHDPARINKLGDRYYTYGTGSPGAPIATRYSDDFTDWHNGPTVFGGIPAWAQAEVPNNPGFMWAPDVFHFGDEYRMYYSVSSFNSQISVIGMATNTTLDFNSPNYAWVDQGMVIDSEVESPYNTIDPGVFYDDSTSRMWLTFGSFWSGVYITELDPATGKRITPNSSTKNIARNPVDPPDAIEAPFLTERDGYYYLFVNWDTCCQGTNSTYKIRVGRSASPNGPFLDRNGTDMVSGGGELFLATEGSVIGPGHFSEYSENNIDYFSYHYYDGNDNGRSKLAIDEFSYTFDGWPILASDLPPGDYNRDGKVDAADYTVWRNSLGSTSDLLANGDDEGSSHGIVDEADYEIWRNNFGTLYTDFTGAGGIGEAVPEPLSCGLLVIGLIACPYRLRRRAPLRKLRFP
jgi:arabinan endo-1,5-alpha-L-arabinosidase